MDFDRFEVWGLGFEAFDLRLVVFDLKDEK